MKSIEIRIRKTTDGRDWLKALQKKSGLSSESIAKRLAIELNSNVRSEATLYCAYVKGHRGLSAKHFPVLAKIFGIGLEEFLRLNNSNNTAEKAPFCIPSDMPIADLLKEIDGKATTAADLLIALYDFHLKQRLRMIRSELR